MNVVAVIALVCAVGGVGIAPWTILFSLLVLPLIIKQNKLFLEKQVKKETFICAVKILAVGAASQAVTFLMYMPFS